MNNRYVIVLSIFRIVNATIFLEIKLINSSIIDYYTT